MRKDHALLSPSMGSRPMVTPLQNDDSTAVSMGFTVV